ncbi:MAG: hypothetical protein FJW96_16740 [Actinobacteria bacterium]|nr:hypothetical protein [Actinomycetota bacterium]
MKRGASVEGDDRLRLFVALRLREADLDRLHRWSQDVLRDRVGRGALRLVRRDDLHVTVAFLGSTPRRDLDVVTEVVTQAARVAQPIELAPVAWRETRAVGMVVLDDRDGAAGRLARAIQAELAARDLYRPEARPWLAHVTTCRFRQPPRLRPVALPEGTCVPSDVAAYVSRLHPSGSRYEVLASVALPGSPSGDGMGPATEDESRTEDQPDTEDQRSHGRSTE